MVEGLLIIEDDLAGEAIAALLALHFDEMHKWAPEDACHVMTVDRLRSPDVTFYSAWDRSTGEGQLLAGCGAVKQLDPRHGELKSMRAAPAYRGKGVGKAILLHLIAEAQSRGYTRLSLETGSGEPFDAALGLYLSQGFAPCEPFGDYRANPFTRFLAREV